MGRIEECEKEMPSSVDDFDRKSTLTLKKRLQACHANHSAFDSTCSAFSSDLRRFFF